MVEPTPRPYVSIRIGSAVWGLAFAGGLTIVMRMAGREWVAEAGFPPIVSEFMPAFHKLLDMSLRAEREAREALAAAEAARLEAEARHVAVDNTDVVVDNEAHPAEELQQAVAARAYCSEAVAEPEKPVINRGRPARKR